jgi:hypothetical protein
MSKTISVNTSPDLTGIVFPAQICQGDDIVAQLPKLGEETQVQWEIPKGFTSISGTGKSYELLFEDSGEIEIALTATNGNCETKWDTVLSVTPEPEKGVISEFAEGLISLIESEGYQWYKDGIAYNASDRQIYPKEDATFTLELTNGACTGQLSDEFQFTYKSVKEEGAGTIYYSESIGGLIVTDNNVIGKWVNIFDLGGRLIFSRLATIQMPLGLAPGSYFYMINDGEGITLSHGSFMIAGR